MLPSVNDLVRPQRRVVDQLPLAGVAMLMPGMLVVSRWMPMGRLYMMDAVWRCWFSWGVEGFGADDVGDGVLTAPVGGGREGDAGGVAVDRVAVGGGLETPALLGGLGAVEAGLFEAKPAPGEAAGEDVEGDVGGVFLVVAEGGDGIFRGGVAVWGRRWGRWQGHLRGRRRG